MERTYRVLVCGGRDYDDYEELSWVLSSYITDPIHGGKIWPIDIISGMARGADSLAVRYAREKDLVLHEYPADWKKYGRMAGLIRNEQMLDEGKPDLVIAFPTKKSRGTWHMIDIAKAAGVEVIVVGP